MKVIKWLMVLSFTTIIIVVLYWVGFAILFSYGAGSGGTGVIKYYEFKSNEKISINKFRNNFDKQNIAIYDTIDKSGAFNRQSVIIYLRKDQVKYMIVFPATEGDFSSFMLTRINGKTNDDFGWFSIEKYKKIRLFEESVIEPLSKKFERVE